MVSVNTHKYRNSSTYMIFHVIYYYYLKHELTDDAGKILITETTAMVARFFVHMHRNTVLAPLKIRA